MALIDKQEFVGLDGIAHLATGGEAPWLRSHDDACRRFGRLIRISAHVHDGPDDVRRCLDELESISPRR